MGPRSLLAFFDQSDLKALTMHETTLEPSQVLQVFALNGTDASSGLSLELHSHQLASSSQLSISVHLDAIGAYTHSMFLKTVLWPWICVMVAVMVVRLPGWPGWGLLLTARHF